MNRSLARFATLALTAPLAVAGLAGSAQASSYSVTVPGCYGAGTAIVCNLTTTVTVPDAAFSVLYVKACAATCYDIPVTYVSTTGSTDVCYRYTDFYGNASTGCASRIIDALGAETLEVRPIHEWLSCNNYGTVCTHQ